MKQLLARATARSGGRKRKRRLGLQLLLLAVALGLCFGVVSFYGIWAQTFDLKKVTDMPERNTVFDVDGKLHARRAGANRLVIPLNEVSPFFVDALVARYDARFVGHGGIDPRGVVRAV